MSPSLSPPPSKAACSTLSKRTAAIIEANLSLVDSVLCQLSRHLPSYADLDDLRSAGLDGLMDAASRFTKGRAATFQGYARIRIRGAIMDAIRVLDPMTRTARKWTKRISRAVLALEAKHGRAATPSEISAELGISTVDLAKWQSASLTVELLSLNVEPEAGLGLHATLFDEQRGPCAATEASESAAILHQLITQLPGQHRAVINGIYYDDMSGREIAKKMGVTEGRVSQLRHLAIADIRQAFQAAA